MRKKLPSKLVQVVNLLTCILKVRDLNLSQDTDHTELGFSRVLSAASDKFRDNTPSWVIVASFHILYKSSFASHSIIARYIVGDYGNVVGRGTMLQPRRFDSQ